jgi:hypothetical protein
MFLTLLWHMARRIVSQSSGEYLRSRLADIVLSVSEITCHQKPEIPFQLRRLSHAESIAAKLYLEGEDKQLFSQTVGSSCTLLAAFWD